MEQHVNVLKDIHKIIIIIVVSNALKVAKYVYLIINNVLYVNKQCIFHKIKINA